MDWSELERRPKPDRNTEQMRIQPKRVAVRRDQILDIPHA